MSNEKHAYMFISLSLYRMVVVILVVFCFREKPLASVGFRGPRVSMENNLSVKGTHVPIKSSKK